MPQNLYLATRRKNSIHPVKGDAAAQDAKKERGGRAKKIRRQMKKKEKVEEGCISEG